MGNGRQNDYLFPGVEDRKLKTVAAVLLALLIGAACRWFDIPVPAPPRLLGALLILAVTIGYLATDHWLTCNRPTDPVPAASQQAPTGEP